MFSKDPSFCPFQSQVFLTFIRQDAFDLLQEELVHKCGGRTAHPERWILAVHIKHYHIIVRACWERDDSESLAGEGKMTSFTFLFPALRPVVSTLPTADVRECHGLDQSFSSKFKLSYSTDEHSSESRNVFQRQILTGSLQHDWSMLCLWFLMLEETGITLEVSTYLENVGCTPTHVQNPGWCRKMGRAEKPVLFSASSLGKSQRIIKTETQSPSHSGWLGL